MLIASPVLLKQIIGQNHHLAGQDGYLFNGREDDAGAVSQVGICVPKSGDAPGVGGCDARGAFDFDGLEYAIAFEEQIDFGPSDKCRR